MYFDRDSELLAEKACDATGEFEFDLEPMRVLPPLDLQRVRIVAMAWTAGRLLESTFVKLTHRDPKVPMLLAHDFDLPFGAVVTGRIVAEGGAPVERAAVELLMPGSQRANPAQEVTSDDLGRFRLGWITGGTMIVRARHTRSGVGEMQVDLTLGRDVAASDLVLHPTGAIRARVTFEDDEPAAGIEVSLCAEGSQLESSPLAQVTTDSEGRFVVRTLALGRYQPRCPEIHYVTDHLRNWEILTTDAPEAQLVLNGFHQIRLHFEDEAGRPIRPFTSDYRIWRERDSAALRALQEGVPLPRELAEHPVLSGSGWLASFLVERGSWLWVGASHQIYRGETVLQVLPPHNVLDLVLHLRAFERTASLRLLLKTSDGGPVSDFQLDLRQVLPGEPDMWDLQPEKTERGLLYRAAPGRYLAVVSPKVRNADMDFGSFAKFEQEVQLCAGSETVLEKTLEPGGRIRFTVHLPDSTEHRRIEDFRLGIASDGQWVPGHLNFTKKLPDGWESGAHVDAGEPMLWQTLLPPGRHELTVKSRDYADAVIGVTIEPRKVTDVDVWLQPR
jgi:hypothetical protein